MHFQPRDELLTAGEILTVARAARDLGFVKIRLTGGEPTVRPELLDIVRGISALGFRAISMTTNGILLDDDWAEFLAKERFLVGLFDGFADFGKLAG